MIYKDGRYYMVKFRWQGKLIRKSTRCENQKQARAVEGKLRAEIAAGRWAILEAKPAPILAEFLKTDFLTYTESTFKSEPKTFAYYTYGVKMLTHSDVADLPLDKITDQHARGFEARHLDKQPSTINCALRTLRRALNLAAEWGKIDRKPEIKLAKNENRRERVLLKQEAISYLEACPQPWRDVATIILGTGARPDEVFRLRWEQVEWRNGAGLIRILTGKTDNAERPLPMLPEVFQVLASRHEAQSHPASGWVFPSESASGHLMQGSAKNQHTRALKASAVAPFPPYTLRHTGLTWIAPYCDAYTLARIAGHSSISMTARYIHPQQHAIERAFAKMASGKKVVRDGGQLPEALESNNPPAITVTSSKQK